MKREEYLKALELYKAELSRQDEKRSTGSIGKLCDVIIRDYILVHGIEKVEDVRCRRLGCSDVIRRKYGKIEIKTGCGAVAYGSNLTKADCIAENVLPGVALICWAPFSAYLTERNAADMMFVLTREQFIEVLEHIGKNGLQSSLKISKQGAQINIQTITVKMEERLWDALDGVPTVREFFGQG